MRCNPTHWLLGLVPIAFLSWIAVQLEHEGIEADLGRRVQDALSRKGLEWAVTMFSGRDGLLSGRAQEDRDPPRALESVRDTWGVRVAQSHVELLEQVGRYLWSATSQGGRLSLSGYVPGEDARRAILSAAQSRFPKAEIEDELKLARGAPDRAVWLAGVSFGLAQLAQLKKGTVDLEALNLSVVGEAGSASAYKSVKTALATQMPAGVKLALEKITGPVASPYVWSAKTQGKELAIAGYTPADALKQDLQATAKKLFPKYALVDRSEIAEGAPDGFAKAAASALTQLAGLKTGSADINAKDLTFVGEAADEATANAVRAALKADVPPAYKITEQIRYPNTAGPFALSIGHDGDAVEVTGMVPSEAERAAVLDAVKTRFSDAKLTDRLQIAAGAPDGWKQSIVIGLDQLARLKHGEAALADRDLTVKGLAENARIAADIHGAVTGNLPQGFSGHDAIEVVKHVEPIDDADKCQDLLRETAAIGVIEFDRASAILTPESVSTLNQLAEIANACPAFRIEIAGHTDSEGSDLRNQRLSDRRAQSVAAFLTSAGVQGSRLSSVGYGASKPVADNATAEGRARNRRIEFTVKAN